MTKIIRFDIKPTEAQLENCVYTGEEYQYSYTLKLDLDRISNFISVDNLWLIKSKVYKAGMLKMYLVDAGIKRYLYQHLALANDEFQVLSLADGTRLNDYTVTSESNKHYRLSFINSCQKEDLNTILVLKNPD